MLPGSGRYLGDPRGLLTSHPIRRPPAPPQRAEANTDREGIALQELARIFKEEEDMPHAAHYFRRILELRGGERGGDGAPEVQEALSFLANFCKERGELREASQYCTRLVDSGSQFKEEAKAMLREIHARTTSA